MPFCDYDGFVHQVVHGVVDELGLDLPLPGLVDGRNLLLHRLVPGFKLLLPSPVIDYN